MVIPNIVCIVDIAYIETAWRYALLLDFEFMLERVLTFR